MTEGLSNVISGVGGAAVGVPIFWLFIKKILLGNATDNASISASDARMDVIELLRAEVQRMSESNKELGESLKAFQVENISLRKEICELHETINSLSDQLSILNMERKRQ